MRTLSKLTKMTTFGVFQQGLLILCLWMSFCVSTHAQPKTDNNERIPSVDLDYPIASAPYFIDQPENITTRLGQRVILACKIGNSASNISAQWTRDNFGLGPNEFLKETWKNIRIVDSDFPESDYSLEINPVTIEDDSFFQCQMSQQKSQTAFVTVWVPPEDPRIIEGPVVEVKENVEVSLRCESKGGKPAAKINWFNQNGNLINDASYQTRRMTMTGKEKLFEATSVVTFTPHRDMNDATFKCHAWNEAADNLKPATVRLRVLYSPSITVTPVKPGMVEEGQEANFRCVATANPPVYENSYKWYVDDKLINGQFGFYFKIQNVTRAYHDKQVTCKVENDLGMASGFQTIEVKYGPSMIVQPRTTSADRLSSVILNCIVDSNPSPRYYWTRGTSREIVYEGQNLTLTVNDDTVGTYICHSETDGFSVLMSRPAEVLMTGPPQITSNPVQTGVLGENIHINCAAISIPEAREVHWRYHGEVIDDGNPHYRVINSPIEHGIRSTLIIRQAIGSDFGPYTCSLKNSLGYSTFEIYLEEQQPFPLQVILICVFAIVIFLLLFAIITILYQRRICCNPNKSKMSSSSTTLNIRSSVSDGAMLDANNAIMKVNNFDQVSYDSTHIKRDLHSPTVSNEIDSLRDGSDNQDGIYRSTTNSAQFYVGNGGNPMYYNSSDLENGFPPKPDVISGYISNSNFVRDLYPPSLLPGQESPCYGPSNCNMFGNVYNKGESRQSSLLNVSDPRYSATYGNPLLRQNASRNVHYSTFCPTPQITSASPALNVSLAPTAGSSYNPNASVLGGGGTNTTNVISSTKPPCKILSDNLSQIPALSSTPNSSISNMACVQEDVSNVLIDGNEHHLLNGGILMPFASRTPSPPPPPCLAPVTPQVPVYVKLNEYRETASPRLDMMTSYFPPAEGGLVVSSSLSGNSQNYPLCYHEIGSLPRHTIKTTSYSLFNKKSDEVGNSDESSGLATRV